MKNYDIAVYIRLSVADEDTGKSKSESDSVANQRKLINRFLDGNKELAHCLRTEFQDDGFSGTNMDRPVFTEMLERVKRGEFNLMYPLRSLVRCGSCGRVMTTRDYKNFYCRYGKYDEASGCTPDRYAMRELEEIVFNGIQMLLQTTENRRAKPKHDASGNLKILAELQKESIKFQAQKLELYEQYSGGEISKQVYLERKNALSKKIAEIEKNIAELENSMYRSEAPATELERAVHEFAGADKLTYELAHAFVSAVYVYADGHVELEWKFGDVAKQDMVPQQ